MIRLITQKNLDTEKWDACIKADANHLFYGYSWYLDMVADEWDALVYGDYEAVLPLVKGRKWGVSYLFRPYGTQQLGVFSKVALTPGLLVDFVMELPKNYKYVEVFLNENNPTAGLNPAWLMTNTNYVLKLNRPYRTIFEGYSKQTLRNLAKAKKHQHRIFEYDSPEQLVTLFRANRGKQISSLTDANYAKILHIMHVMLHKRRGYLWTIYDEYNTIIAGAYFVEMGGRITLLFSATNETGKKHHAMTYLLDELFIARAGDDVLFDFEGSNIPSLAQFYAGFGAEARTYYTLRINLLPPPFRWLKK